MQTTLRINDSIYREAKAQAALAGISLTRFIEDALRQKLDQPNQPSESESGFTVRESTPAYEISDLDPRSGRALAQVLQEFETEEEGSDKAWSDEIGARIYAVKKGKAKGVSLETFMHELDRRLNP